MNILSLFVVIPLLMLLGLWISRNLNQVRGVMVAGSSCLLLLSVWLTITFIQMRSAGETAPMLFTLSLQEHSLHGSSNRSQRSISCGSRCCLQECSASSYVQICLQCLYSMRLRLSRCIC